MIGAVMTVTGMPASVRAFMAFSRARGAAARGSIVLASVFLFLLFILVVTWSFREEGHVG